jgi:predicted nucleic acid-binding protein
LIDINKSQKIVAISNTGPLISAFQCEKVDLLKLYFSLVYITVTELAELQKHGWSDEIQRLINDKFIVVIEQFTDQEKEEAIRLSKKIAKEPSSGDKNWHSHIPEAEAMTLMLKRMYLKIEIILLDEKSARNIAQEMKLSFTGFPGLLAKAGLDGLLTQNDIRKLLKTCQQHGTHYSDHLIETTAKNYGR